MNPTLIKGNIFSDDRGSLSYNNDFNASQIKRLYCIENKNLDFIRGWQGHTIEQRWFTVTQGAFEIKVIKIDDWNSPSKDLKPLTFTINSNGMDVLHVPQGHITSIQAVAEQSKLLVMSDYVLGETKDEHRYAIDYFI